MSTYDRLLEILKEVFEDEIDLAKVNPEARLVEDLEMKSIGMLYMAMAIEQEFDVKFENEDLMKLRTVQDIIDKVDGR